MSLRERPTIPAFLHIDVEPDAFQIKSRDEREWSGYSSAYRFVNRLRDDLTRSTGVPAHFGWYFRMDPQIEATCGRADAAIRSFEDRVSALQAAGDYFGVHAHPLRWSAEEQTWVHDFGDTQWLRECTEFSLDCFETCTGGAAELYRSGAGFLNNDIVEILDERGVLMEMSLEPVASWGLNASVVPTGIDSSPIRGVFVDCQNAPHTPYQPARSDFRQRGGDNRRPIVLVPLSTGPRVLPSQHWASKAKRILRGQWKAAPLTVLYPTLDWPSPRHFWDIVAFQLDRTERPYVSLAIRTDAPDSEWMKKAYQLFAALPGHPIAQRLRFVNPLSVRDELISA
jgi:hypothetical protein